MEISAAVAPESPSAIGARAEMAVASALIHLGHNVYLPMFAPHSRVDLVFEDGSGLHRVQCKTSKVARGAVVFRTCSNTGNDPRHYRGEVDFFGVHCPPLGTVYLVPIDVTSDRGCQLRLEPARNNQRKRVHWARDYEIRTTAG